MKTNLTESKEDYLEAIFTLVETRNVARVKEIAAALGVKVPSVANAVSDLKKMGYVEQEPYGYVSLTESGREIAMVIAARHALLRRFLMLLGVPEEIADSDACVMEHILSKETLDAIESYCNQRESNLERQPQE